MPDLEELQNLIGYEITQRTEEGCDTSGFLELFEKTKDNEKDLMRTYKKLSKLKIKKDFPYDEPSLLGKIRKKRERAPEKIKTKLSDDELHDKIYGVWLGRCAGCMLGKPVEGWMHQNIKKYLEGAGKYPLSDYFPENSSFSPEGVRVPQKYCTKGNFNRSERDDDTDYTIIGLDIMEKKGRDFTSIDVMNEWLSSLPYHRVYTAERCAYRNAVDGVDSDKWALYLNPYREWIGAQIRADFWGYVAYGNPELASEFAYRDASISHVKNGIYGEMLFSAIISASFVSESMEGAIMIGLSEIPKNSRLAETVRDCVKFRKECKDFEEARSKVMDTYYGKYHPVHTNNNAAIVLLGLLFCENDFEKAICYSVSAGLDTDCNGATAGSVMGAFLGAKKLPEKWISPLNDTLASSVIGFSENRISDLAERTLKVAKEL